MEYKELYELIENAIKEYNYDKSILGLVSVGECDNLENINWAGFYTAVGDVLLLDMYYGKEACREIKFGKGVCGTCAETKETQVVPDVSKFKGHIACDSDSKSEIVIPVYKRGKFYGVFDVDSPVLNRFGEKDKEELEAIVRLAEKYLDESFD